MKFLHVLALSAWCYSSTSRSEPLHKRLDYERYLVEAPDLEPELDAWLAKYENEARQRGWYPKQTCAESKKREDLLQRFYLAKQHIAVASKLNPHANFSTDSPFTLLTDEEFGEYFASARHSNRTRPAATATRTVTIDSTAESPKKRHLQTSLDLSTHPCLGAVEDQGTLCANGDYIFAAVAAVEAGICFTDGASAKTKLSEQHLINCSPDGCLGGTGVASLERLQANGICYHQDIQWTGFATSCSLTCRRADTRIKELAIASDATSVELVLQDKQPITASVMGGFFKQYRGGYISSCGDETKLGPANFTTTVLIVGYDETTFKVRGSFGTIWGENGHVRIARNSQSIYGRCGIYYDTSYPIICELVAPRNAVSSWFFRSRTGTQISGCGTTDSTPKSWVMLNAYRRGGTENVHWKYTNNPNDPDCLNNWTIYDSTGQNVMGTVSGRLTVDSGSTRTWCALNTYRSGGIQGKQWEYCACN